MKNQLPNFEDFILSEGKINNKVIEIAEKIEKALPNEVKMDSKELDAIAKKALSSFELKFYKDYKDIIIEMINDNDSIDIHEEQVFEKNYRKFNKMMIGGQLPDTLDFVKDYMEEVINIISKKATGSSYAILKDEKGKGATKPILDEFNKKYDLDWREIKKALHLK